MGISIGGISRMDSSVDSVSTTGLMAISIEDNLEKGNAKAPGN